MSEIARQLLTGDDDVKEAQPLLTPVKLGPYSLPNRIVMAPMTRSRADNRKRAPTALHAEYYAQRATAGLIVTEGTNISLQGVGYIHTPGIYSRSQIKGWRRVSEAVHARDGHIFLQLWHVGRLSHPDFHGGDLPVAPSAINPEARSFTAQGFKDTLTPRALTTRDVRAIVGDYLRAAKNAMRAGFDGVELHGANGYLIEQFLRDSSNRRTDRYGGSVANRARFLFEIVEEISEAIGSGRLGVRLSPASIANNPPDSDIAILYDFVVSVLSGYDLAYLHLVEAPEGNRPLTPDPEESVIARYRTEYRGTLIANNGYDRERGNALIADGQADLVAYGRPFIANPDLPERFRSGVALASHGEESRYGAGAAGYVDYSPLPADVV